MSGRRSGYFVDGPRTLEGGALFSRLVILHRDVNRHQTSNKGKRRQDNTVNLMFANAPQVLDWFSADVVASLLAEFRVKPTESYVFSGLVSQQNIWLWTRSPICVRRTRAQGVVAS